MAWHANQDRCAQIGCGEADPLAPLGGASGAWRLSDSPFYDVYACADGRHISVAALEPQFYGLLIKALGLNDLDLNAQNDESVWPAVKSRFKEIFASRPSAHWRALLEGTDECFAPVLSVNEAINHPHNVAREIFRVDDDGTVTVKVAPRFLPLGED